MTWLSVCPEDDLHVDQLNPFTIDGVPIVLVKVAEEWLAFKDQCSHQDVPLSAFGAWDGKILTCLAHGAKFSGQSGEVLCPPAKGSLKKYSLRNENGVIQVALNEENS